MTGDDCLQQGLDNNWSLARSNACHIEVSNHEMGQLRDEMVIMNGSITYLLWGQGITTAIWIFIACFIGKKALTQMWGKK